MRRATSRSAEPPSISVRTAFGLGLITKPDESFPRLPSPRVGATRKSWCLSRSTSLGGQSGGKYASSRTICRMSARLTSAGAGVSIDEASRPASRKHWRRLDRAAGASSSSGTSFWCAGSEVMKACTSASAHCRPVIFRCVRARRRETPASESRKVGAAAQQRALGA
eukprot:3850182-Prymnesium_polylepis.1